MDDLDGELTTDDVDRCDERVGDDGVRTEAQRRTGDDARRPPRLKVDSGRGDRDDVPGGSTDDDGRFEQDAPFRVGSSQPNAYGLFDVGWNVHEWCSDWYDANYYGASPHRDPQGPPTGERRASRGGAWRHQIKVSRSAARSSIPPDRRYNDYGFRVAASIGE